MPSNIAQIEFFLVGSNLNQSLESAMQECRDRAQEGSDIKVCFRIYDEKLKITSLANKINAWNKKYGEFGELIAKDHYPCFINSFRIWRIGKKKLTWKAKLDVLVRQRVCDHLRLRRAIAIERPDHSYRLVKRNERYELEGKVKRAGNQWTFVFEPSDLLADQNKLLVCVM